MIFPIPDWVWNAACDYEARVLKAVEGRDNYTGVYAANRYRTGYLGEWAFACWLEHSGIPFRQLSRADGRSDRGDFVVGVSRKIVDVKTTQYIRATELRVYESQWWHVEKYADALVQAKVLHGAVELCGAVSVQTFKKIHKRRPGDAPVLYVELSRIRGLGAIEEFLSRAA